MNTTPRVVAYTVLQPYVIALEFSDGVRSEVDLKPYLRGEVFTPLKDPALFAQAFLDRESVAWPNGADFAPEFLHDLVTRRANTQA